jgi:hypothetical protein
MRTRESESEEKNEIDKTETEIDEKKIEDC